MRFKLLFLFIAFLTFGKVQAQVDSIFWFAAPWVTPGHANNVPVVLRFSTFNAPTTIRIQQPAGTYDTTFTVAPNSLFSKTLSQMINTLESKPANTVLNYGLKITSDTLMTVVYEVVTTQNNPETYSLKGQNGLGTEFVAPFQTRWNNGSFSPQPKSMFCIVATENNTTVYITPKAPIIGHPAGITYSVVLQAGQTYTCENVTPNSATPGNNLSGSIIVSDKPIAVTVSDDSVAAESGGCRDLMGDQIVPVDVVGTEYIINKGNMIAAAHEGIYVVATQNFTTLNINNGLTITTQLLNRGDTYFYDITQPLTYVTADKNVYMLQASGFGCELGEAIIPPINCAGSKQVSFTRTNSQTFILNILCRSTATGSFTLNGSTTLVPASAFSFVPGTNDEWSGAQITFSTATIPAGTANLLSNSSDVFALGVINGGSTSGCLYHYMSSFIRRVVVVAANDTTLCNGDPSVALTGSVSEGATTGMWSVLNGTGTLNNPTSLSTTYVPSQADYAQGTLTFVLTSTGNCNPVSDTMRINFIQSAIVTAGSDNTYCKNNVGDIPISGSVSYAAAAVWSGGNGGAFGNTGSPSTTYTPSPADFAADSVALYLTSQGSFFACPNDQDTVIIYFTDPATVIAGPDQNLCSNAELAELNGTISGNTSTGIWTSTGNGAFSPSQNNLNTDYLISSADTTTGQVVIYLTSTNNGNCLAVTDSLYINIFSKPEIEITTADSICSNISAINLTGTVSAGFSTIWSTTGAGTINSPSSPDTYYNISPLDINQGYLDVRFSTTAAICPVESDSLRITFVDPPAVYAGNDQEFCNNVPIQLVGAITGANTSGSWSTLGTGTFTPSPNLLSTNYIPSAADVAAGSVTLILSSGTSFGCAPEKDTVVMTFKDSPVADFTATTSCQNENTEFFDQSTSTDGTISTWYWDFGDNVNSIAQNPLHNYPFAGNFTPSLIVTSSNGCSDTVEMQITVLPLPIPNFTSSIGCEKNPIQFTDNSFISTGSIVGWSYDFGGGNIIEEENPVYTYPTSGTFPVTLTVTSALGCSNSVTIPVTIQQSPTADFTINPNPALVLEPVSFNDESYGDNPIISWYWDFGDGEADNSQNTAHTYELGGDYPVTLTVTDNIGCQGKATQIISLSLLPVLPTGFTPNGDGENDVFIIRGGPFQAVDFNIYNNWGELIFSTQELDKGWDGTYKGEQVPIGVYTWTFVVNVADGKVFRESGDVTLMR